MIDFNMKKKVVAGSLVATIVTSNTIGVEGMENVIQTEILKQEQSVEVVETENKVLDEIEDVVVEETEDDTEVEVKEDIDSVLEATTEEVQTTEDIEKETSNIVQVNDETSLRSALKDDAQIILTSNIVLTELLDMRVNNVTIDGNGFSIIGDSSLNLLNKNLITLRFNNNTIKNLTIEGYDNANAAILAYNTSNAYLENITCKGVNGVSKTGVDISGGSNTRLKDINTSNNYQAGIRLKNGANVTLLGTNTHSRDSYHVVLDNTTPNNFVNNGQYEEIVVSGASGTHQYFQIPNMIDVGTEAELEAAVLKSNTIINIVKDFTITKEIEIPLETINLRINGGGHTIDCDENGSLAIKSVDTEIDCLTFKNYLNSPVMVYNATNITLSRITLEGNSILLEDGLTLRPNVERSKIGIDIYDSKGVVLDEIVSKNHLYKGIQIRKESEVTMQSTPIHFNDTIHMQTIKGAKENDVVVNDTSKHYKEYKTEVDSTNKTIVNYATKQEIAINSAQDLVDNAFNSGTVFVLNNDIDFNNVQDGNGFLKEKGLNISQNIEIKGNNHTIDLTGVDGLIVKGDFTRVEDVRIANSDGNGLSVYNSKNSVLKGVIVENNKAGIVANGSIVDVIDCQTINNSDCGILVTRSRTLDKVGATDEYRDSIVTIRGTLEQKESNRCMLIRNLEMIYSPDYVQDNKLVFESAELESKYRNIEKAEKKMELSDYYKEVFGEFFEQNGIDVTTKFGTTETDVIKVLVRMDVTNQTECIDENGDAIQLDPTGTHDNTEKFKQLLKYATLNGKELYFPQGTYKITGDINLTQLGTPAFCNVQLTGESNGLSIIDGSLADKMLLIDNSDYHYNMAHINVNNLAFDNVGLKFNGVYKDNVSINDNIFMNGKYTDENGKVTMIPYITANNATYLIENNIFLRGEEYAGRGISTYATKNTIIRNNFFGNIEGKDDAATMLPSNVIDRLNLVTKTKNVSGKQGNFFTAINNERRDTNVTIENNYFNMNDGGYIEGVPADRLISGINVAVDGQRKDHIIYSKGYNGLNIVGNYFKGMSNNAKGGVKLRNGSGAYVGSNHFKDVPLLTYIYGDLTQEECLLHNTTIYNNLFHETKNMGGEGTGILYYQSFRNGDTLNFSNGTTWTDAFGDVQNFVVYKNKFKSNAQSEITISNRADKVKDQFYMYGNVYEEMQDVSVSFDKGNMSIADTTVDVVQAKVNDGYAIHNGAKIPLYPAQTDTTQLDILVDEITNELSNIKDSIGLEDGQYNQYIAEELWQKIEIAKELLQDTSAIQWEINNLLLELQNLLEKLKKDINTDGGMGIKPDPEVPGDDFDDDMFVDAEDLTAGDGTANDDMMVTPDSELEVPGDDFDAEMGVMPDEEVLDGTANDDMMVTPEANVNAENNTTNDNPKTGDNGIVGYVGLGLASILGMLKNRRKRK